ncbi:MAG: C1 family peptidase [Planctomycetes bacterium]|nr:C1 family peptidase [Planctomycetota bacterium]
MAATTKTTKKPGKFILNCIPSRETQNDWSPESAESAGLLAAAPVPVAKDLRAGWWAIGDQGSTGSCVGWATADSVLRWHFVNAGRLTQQQLLSMRYVWMAAKETDQFVSRPTTFIEVDGTSLKAALDVARKFGVVLDNDLPFASGKLFAGKADTFYALAAQRRVSAYFNLGTSAAAWRRWLAFNGPVLTRLNVDATWYAATSTKGKLDAYSTSTAGGGHAVALVGYTADRFIVRNSWGTSWGDKGFAYASDAYAAAAFSEAYGVTL